MTEAEFNVKNKRRGDLIGKKYGQGLTDSETSELQTLQAEVGVYINQRFPLPDFSRIYDHIFDQLEAAADRAEALRKKIEARRKQGLTP